MQYSTTTTLFEAKYSPIKSVVVVTPTIGSNYLKRAISSVHAQKTDVDVTHLIVYDGPMINEHEFSVPYQSDNPWRIEKMILPWNVGKDNYYGHRVYAAIGHLINADAVFFLDEDNWYSSKHIQTCVETLNNDLNLDFTFSYREIHDREENFVAYDRFEAIGKSPLMLVDTSSYCFRREFLIKYGHIWHWKWGADRRFFQSVAQFSQYKSSGYFTLNYRLDGNPGSPSKEFFFEGNRQAGYSPDGIIKL